MKSLNKNKQIMPSDQTRSCLAFNPRWIEEFRLNMNRALEHFEQHFNRLINPNLSLLSINEQIKSIQALLDYIKPIQITCSDIQSSLIVDKQRELKDYITQLIKKSQDDKKQNLSSQMHENLIRLLWDLLITLIKYIQTYCQAFLIPYEVEIRNEDNKSTDIERFKSPVKL
jgi:hypothetical protein